MKIGIGYACRVIVEEMVKVNTSMCFINVTKKEIMAYSYLPFLDTSEKHFIELTERMKKCIRDKAGIGLVTMQKEYIISSNKWRYVLKKGSRELWSSEEC